MVKKWVLVGALLLGMPLSLFAQERYAISYGGFAGFQATIWAMQDLGLLAKYGLNGDLVMIPGTARGVQALLAGSTHFAQVDATGPISAVVQGGDIVIVAASLNKFPFSMVAQKEIRRPAELVGKKVGIINFGGANELAVVLALKEWNIPRQAVTLLPSGEAATRLVGMASKALDATVLSPPETIEAARMGLNILAHMSDLKASFPMNAIAVRRSFMEKNRDVVKRFLQAHSEATLQFITHKEKGLAVYSKRLKQKNPKVIEETYTYYGRAFSFPPRVAHEGMRHSMDLVAQRAAGGKVDVNLERYLDESVVDELEREGFFKEIARR